MTGAAGFAGSHLLDLLTRDGARVIAWHRPGGKPAGPDLPNTVWQPVDLLDRAAVRAAVDSARPDFVYHCAGAAHVGSSWNDAESTFATNVRGSHNLVDALRDSGSRARVLFPSSALVYAETSEPIREDHQVVPTSPYGLSKLAQEMVGANGEGVNASIARSFNHFGPRQDARFAASAFAKQIAEIEAGLKEPVLSVGNLEARRDLTDVRDTVRAYRVIVENGPPGRIYNVCSGRALAIRDVLDMLLARSSARIEVKTDPSRYRPNDLPLVVGDPTRIRTELGWTPVIPPEQTADDLLEFWRAQVHERP